MADITKWWKAIADDYFEYDGEPPDYNWLLERMLDAAHPRLGPPAPPSLLDQTLRAIYAPGLQAQINRSNVLLGKIRGQHATLVALDEVSDV